MRSSVLLASLLASVTVAVVAVSAQSALDQLKAYNESAPPQGKAGTAPAVQAKGTAIGFPDIAGLRIGMPLREAFTILQTAHPGAKLGTYPIDIPGIGKPVLEGFSFGYASLAPQAERVVVDVTPPPNQQVVWKVRRYLAQQKIYRANVLSSLREKYGKETATSPAVANDQQIRDMWWVLNEQGRPEKLPPPGVHWQTGDQLVNDCARTFVTGDPGGSWFAPNNLEGQLKNLDSSEWCKLSGVALHASVPTTDIVETLYVEMFDVPLAVRSGSAEMRFVNDVGKRQQQQQIDQSKQARPKL